jgi:FAD/FMN-containing dehydrogenase
MAENGLTKIVDGKSILDSEEVLEEYSRDNSFAPRVRPKCLVKLKNADEVQALVKWANESLTPLVPVSSGGPHFRGDTVPSTGGAVVVDLSEMKKVVRIDRRNRVAMVEPGITFSELIPQLEKEGLRLNMPLLPRGNKSVIGSMLEREPVIIPLSQWDAIDPLTCIEVIFGTGDMFRTGSAAGPGTLEEQWKSGQAQVNPMGPGQTDFARVVQGAQGTMGIVTWSTIRCEAMPTLQKPFLVGCNKYEKLAELVYKLMWLKAGDECFILNGTDLAAILAKTPAEYNNLRDALPSWVLFFSLSGYEYYPEERVAYQEEQMAEAAQRLGLEPTNAVSGVSAYEVLRLVAAPSEEPYWKLRYKGGCQDLFFLTTLDRVQKLIDVMYDQVEQSGYSSADLGIYVQPMVQGTSCHCEFNLYYDPANEKEAARVRELYTKAAEALMNAGAFFSRPYGAIADMAYRRDGETTAALRKVKQIFDPNNIMNSGKLCF